MPVQEHSSGPYRDDRMYVMRITTGSTRVVGGFEEVVTGPESESSAGSESVMLVTYRNVPSLPPTRVDDFSSLEDAIQYVKKVEPICPRCSLGGSAPEPIPSWQEHLAWLHGLGLRSAAEGDEPRPDWAIREGKRPDKVGAEANI